MFPPVVLLEMKVDTMSSSADPVLYSKPHSVAPIVGLVTSDKKLIPLSVFEQKVEGYSTHGKC